jgi:type I restriction enzyme S subunit
MAAVNVSSGSKMPRAEWKHLVEVPFTVPPIQEQQKIVAVLSAADAELQTLETQLSALRTQKRGLMQRLLTGKTRVSLS